MSRWCLLFCFQAKCSTCDTPLCMKSDFQRERDYSAKIYASCSENSGTWGQSRPANSLVHSCLTCSGVRCPNPKESKGNDEGVRANFSTKGSTASEGSEEQVQEQTRATLSIAWAGLKVPETLSNECKSIRWGRRPGTGQAEAVPGRWTAMSPMLGV